MIAGIGATAVEEWIDPQHVYSLIAFFVGAVELQVPLMYAVFVLDLKVLEWKTVEESPEAAELVAQHNRRLSPAETQL